FVPWTVDVQAGELGDLTQAGEVRVRDGIGGVTFQLYEAKLGGIGVVLFENESVFGGRHPYGDEEGPYPDNWRRYALFARAVLAAVEPLSFPVDIFHCFDWTTGLVPVYHQLEYVDKNRDHPATAAGTYFAIHNLAMQGTFEREILPRIK